MRHLLATTALVLLTAPVLHAQAVTETQKLTASDGQAGDDFGTFVGIDGNRVIVGARGAETGGVRTGAAYVFDLDMGTEIRLSSPDGAFADNFGQSVAISGATALVGAIGNSEVGNRAGAAYLFDATTGMPTFKLTPSDGEDFDLFGFKSTFVEGKALVSSINGNSPVQADTGAVYLFDPATGTETGKLFALGAIMGDSVTSADISGNVALLGAGGDDDKGFNAGAAYIVDLTAPRTETKITPSDIAPEDGFGGGVAIVGTTGLIRSQFHDDDRGAVYAFDLTTGTQTGKWTASDAAPGDTFGNAMATSGRLAVIGAWGDDSETGAAYLFDTETGTELAKLKPSDATSGNRFGMDVAISGATALIGTLDGEAAYVFDLSPKWNAFFGGNYDDIANWETAAPVHLPDAVVTVAPDTTQIVTGPAGVSAVGSLILGGGAGTVTLDLQQGGGIVSQGLVRVDAGGVLTGDGGVIAPFILNEGTIDLQPGLGLNARVINEGMVQGQGTVGGDFVNDRGAQTIGGSGQQITFAGAVDNFGTIGGSDTTMRFQQGVENRSDGEMQFSGGFTSLFGDIDNGAFARIVNSGNGTLTMFDAVSNDGEIRTSGSGATVIFGDYSGPGTLTGGGTVFFEGSGTTATGSSPALASFTGDIFMGAARTTEMELGGTERGILYDAWDITGALGLGGTLNLVGLPGFFPSAGDSFTLFSATEGISGDFDTLNLLSLSGGLKWTQTRTATTYGLAVSAVPLPAGVWMLLAGLGALAWRRRAG